MAASRRHAIREVRAVRAPRLGVLAAAAFLACSLPAAGDAQERPLLVRALEVVHDEERGIVTARGNVEVSQDDRVLQADAVAYDMNTNTVVATGAVILHEPTGEVIHSSRVVLENELKDGIIENLRMMLSDGSRVAAHRATREGGVRKTMERAVYSPCLPCEDGSSRPPLWQIKADSMTHDEVGKNVIYEDATLEMFGIPVAYSPFLTHPDPTVKRRSGLLTPTFGHSDELGFIYGQPYYQVLDQSSDIELEPIAYTREGMVLRGRYRHALNSGNLDLKATAGLLEGRDETDRHDLQGSVDMTGRFSLSEDWRSGFDIEQASNRTYLRRYRLGGEEILTSRAFLEGFRAEEYASVEAYRFQGLRSGDDRSRQPTVLPVARYSFDSLARPAGGNVHFDATAFSISRGVGAESRKLSLVTEWSRPWRDTGGYIYELNAVLQSDLYATRPENREVGNDGHVTLARLFPQFSFSWRYPLARTGESGSQTVEPIVSLVVGPTGGNRPEIPDEDSQAFEFDDINIFDLNRFSGTDRVTSGSRLDYGINVTMFDTGFHTGQASIAQSYRLAGESSFDPGSGLYENLSDVVGRLRYSPADWLDLLWRYRLSKDNLKPRRTELGVQLNRPDFGVLLDYVQLDDHVNEQQFGDREQLDLRVRLALDENVHVSTQLIHDLSDNDSQIRSANTGLVYADECFAMGMQYERLNFRDDDIEPEHRFSFRLNFKYLGSVQSSGIQ